MITKNSAKCTACGVEIVSMHRHDFVVHYCEKEPTQKREWVDGELLEVEDQTTWRFAVDGGKAYIKRCGTGYIETSEGTDEEV